MNINIGKVPHAIAYFAVGLFTTLILWEFLPTIISALHDTNLLSSTTEIDAIIWGGAVIFCIIIMLGLPAWCLFETEEGT